MKRIFCIVLSVLLLVILAVPVTAHSGMTDAAGGHYDSSTGEYHYHHGYPAHQHTNGKCPYDYKDKTNHSSVGSTSSSSSGCNDAGSIISVLFGIFCLGSVFAFLVFICVAGSDHKRKPNSSLKSPPPDHTYKQSTANESAVEKGSKNAKHIVAGSSSNTTSQTSQDHPINFQINNAHVGVNQWELDLLSSIQQAYNSIHDLKVSLDLPIIQNNFDVHLAAMLNGLSRIIMYQQLNFVALDEEKQNKIINLIDSHFLKTVEKPNNYFYFSCSDFYQNSFPIWFKNKSAHSYWYDEHFRLQYQNIEDKPLMRTIYSILASFGDIILNEHLSNDYDLLDTYFTYDIHSIKLSDEHMNIFRKNFMIPVTKIVEDYFEVCWDYMQCCYKVEEIN